MDSKSFKLRVIVLATSWLICAGAPLSDRSMINQTLLAQSEASSVGWLSNERTENPQDNTMSNELLTQIDKDFDAEPMGEEIGDINSDNQSIINNEEDDNDGLISPLEDDFDDDLDDEDWLPGWSGDDFNDDDEGEDDYGYWSWFLESMNKESQKGNRDSFKENVFQ